MWTRMDKYLMTTLWRINVMSSTRAIRQCFVHQIKKKIAVCDTVTVTVMSVGLDARALGETYSKKMERADLY